MNWQAMAERAGKNITFTWLVSGVYLFAVNDDAKFLSMEGLMFFVAGTLIVSVGLGHIDVAIRRSASKLLRLAFADDIDMDVMTGLRPPPRGFYVTARLIAWTTDLLIMALTFLSARDWVLSGVAR